MYKLQQNPDKSATLENGSEVAPLATLKDEYGGVSHIIKDDKCFVLINKQSPANTYGFTSWWYNEAAQAMKGLL